MTKGDTSRFCHWCGKACIASEMISGNETQGYSYLCSFCIKFPTVGVMYDWMGIIANYALTNKSVILDSMEYDEESEKWIISFTYYDNDQVRMGWVV